MAKKILALVCVLAVLTGISAATVLQADASAPNYQVGFSRVDINPYIYHYVDENRAGETPVELFTDADGRQYYTQWNQDESGNTEYEIMELPLRGSGDVWNRLSNVGLVDDNGDGVVNGEDGLKVTCVAVTDGNGKTVLLITVDLIGGTLISKVRTEICARVEEALTSGELENVDITADQIYYAGTHTHNAPDTTVYTSKGKTGTNNDGVDLSVVNENLGIFIERTVASIGDAAIAALKDRAAATITKDQISASEATSESVVGKVMASTRHYNTVDHDGEEFVAGDNFNALSTSEYNTSRGDYPEQVTKVDDTMYLLQFAFKDSAKLPIIISGWRGHPSLNNSDSYSNGGRHCLSSDFVNAFRHALEYGCDVVTNTTDGSGYVESWTLGTEQKYRVAFFQGTGGNVNPRGYEIQKDENGNDLTYGTSNALLRAYTWIDRSASLAAIKGRACSYGVVLADMAEEGLTDGKNVTPVKAGNIQTVTKSVTAARKTTGVTQASYNASVAYQSAASLYTTASSSYTTANSAYKAYVKAYDANQTAYNEYLAIKKKYDGFMGNWIYKGEYEAALSEYNSTQSACDEAKATYEEAMATHSTNLSEYATFMEANTVNNYVTEATATVDYATPPDKPLQELPFLYSANGEFFAIGSKFHASSIIGDWNKNLGIPKTTGTTVKLSAILLAKDLAFVVVPGEPYDYYYKETGVYTPENNLWNSLIDEDTYGKPFVLGYCNGAQGYFPNYEAYTYNEGSTTKAVGSYEAHNTGFAQGFGEEMIGHFGQLLTSMVADSREAVCQHCKESVTWQPYQGQTALTTGHYYLASDYEGAQIKIADTNEVCFDLNGYTFTGTSRAFYTSSEGGKAVLSIMDSSDGETGVLQGCGGEFGASRGFGGGTILVAAGHELNLYSGTFTSYDCDKHSTSSGDVLLVRGNLNMYGGTVTGGTVSSYSGTYFDTTLKTVTRVGVGGNITVTGTFNMYGGKVTGGATQKITGSVLGDETLGYANQETVEAAEGTASCVCIDVYSSSKGKLNLYGAASIDHVYFDAVPVSNLSVNGNYTGTVELQFSSKTTFAAFDVVGVAKADDAGNRADVSGATISFTGCDNLTAAVKDTNLVLSETNIAYAYCEGCKEYVQWTPMADADFDKYNGSTSVKTFPTGHYVLTENVGTEQKQLNGDGNHAGTFCIDLAGFTFTGASRAFYCNAGVTLNIMDSAGGGIVEGLSGSATGGAVLYSYENSTVNLYSGTVRHNTAKSEVTLAGGVVRANGGTFNIYGGTVQGGHVTSNGGAIYVTSRTVTVDSVKTVYYGSFGAYGGEVTMGVADTAGPCVYVQNNCSVTLSGAAKVADIYFAGAPANSLSLDTTSSAFTGTARLTCATQPVVGAVVGTCAGNLGMADGVIVVADSEMSVAAKDGQLITVITGVNLMAGDEVYANYPTLSQAVAAYTYDAEIANYIKLNTNSDETVSISGTVYLDLNGHSISGSLTVADGAMLYCMDSQTDDYTVEDAYSYGKLASVTCRGTGGLEGLPENSDVALDGYLMVTEQDGVSFHRVNLQINGMSLRASNVGVYYTCNFAADEIAAAKVNKFGVALSVYTEPDAETLQFLCEYSAFTNFRSGAGGNAGATTGTLLRNIMRTTNTDEVNLRNATTAVYGRAYIETEDGYMFGSTVVRTLQDQVEGVDQTWISLTETQKKTVLSFYEIYASVMEDWEIPNIKQAYAG